MRTMVLCLDISESMGYGKPAKLNQAIEATLRAVRSIGSDVLVGLVTFEADAETILEPQPVSREQVEAELRKLTVRGVSCIASGFTEAIRLTC